MRRAVSHGNTVRKVELFILGLCLASGAVMVWQAQKLRTMPAAEDINAVAAALKEPQRARGHGRWDGDQICSTVDVVYTWVNGSDPEHKREMRKYGGGGWDGGYRDYGVIKYSARSVAKFMPWVRNIVLVTNGQVPNWVNTSSPRFRLVTHSQIFENQQDLPTFNSNAIEANLRNIPGIAPCFLYLNDDMFLAAPISKDRFFDEHGNLKIDMSRGFVAPMKDRMRSNLWHRSVGNSNDLINKYYYPDAKEPVKHSYVSHTCYFMRTDVCRHTSTHSTIFGSLQHCAAHTQILKTIGERWHDAIQLTSSHRFRKGEDTAMPFMHGNVALEEFGAVKQNMHNLFGTWTTDRSKNDKFWEKVWDKGNGCVCMNDQLDNSKNAEQEIQHLQQLFEEKLPEKSFIEK